MKRTMTILLVLLSILSLTSALYAIGLPPPPDKPPAVEPTNSPTPTEAPTPKPTDDPFLSPLVPAGPFCLTHYVWYDGTAVTRDEFRDEFGAFEIESGGRYHVSELRAVTGPVAFIVTVLDRHGPVEGEAVVFAWPDGQTVGWTNEDGKAEFPMGRGAYYFPDNGETGPHSAWLAAGSDWVYGVGMLGGTPHNHFDVTFTSAEPITYTYVVTMFLPVVQR